MPSRNARFLKRGLLKDCRRMTPTERVRAFIEHSRVLIKIKEAGDARRKRLSDRKEAQRPNP